MFLVVALMMTANISAQAKYRTVRTPDTSMEVTFICGKPNLASGKSWYRGITGKSTIASIVFTNELPENLPVQETWDASEEWDDTVTAVVSGSTLYVSSNGGTGFKANSDMSYAFRDFVNLTSIEGLELIDTSETTSLRGLFDNSQSLVSVDLNAWDTKNVTDISRAFRGCTHLETLNIDSWDVNNVISMEGLFQNDKYLREINITGWSADSLAKVFDAENLFDGVGIATQSLTVKVGSQEVADWIKAPERMFPDYGVIII